MVSTRNFPRCPGNFRNRALVIVVLFVYRCLWSHAIQNISDVSSTSFEFPNFDQNAPLLNLTLWSNASYSLQDTISITPNTNDATLSLQSTGQVLYKAGIKMRDLETNSTASFNTTFTFSIMKANQSSASFGADGIAFFIVANGSSTVAAAGNGKNLGLFHPSNDSTACGNSITSTFAVEFDTFMTQECGDINSNHVGVDIDSPKSVISADAQKAHIDLNGGNQVITAWIEYDHSSALLEVRISNSSSARPADPLISISTIDLSSVFKETMWVGFSGSTGGLYQYQTLYSWSFISYGLPLLRYAHAGKPGSKKLSTAVLVGLAGSFISLFLAFLIILGYYWIVRQKVRNEHDNLVISVDTPHQFTYKQLSVATAGFSETSQLGGGGFGSVYRGKIHPGKDQPPGTMMIPVAVKRMNHDSKQGVREFVAEVNIISRLRHRNLVQLLGWCKDDGKFLLVYELMPNGSLDQALFITNNNKSNPPPVLSWPQRLKIIRGIAAALDYLHEGWQQQVIHRDVKASNVMLDKEFNAKLGDFGLARLIEHQHDESKAETTVLAGTWGYIAPECAQTGTATDKSDVFSFGALVLEIACGRPALDRSLPPNDSLLLNWTWALLSNDNLLNAADPRLEGDFEVSQMQIVLLVGLICSHPDAAQRPTMRQVAQILAGEAPVPPVPRSQPVANYRTSSARLLYQALMIDGTSSGTSTSTITSSVATSSSGVLSARSDSSTTSLLDRAG